MRRELVILALSAAAPVLAASCADAPPPCEASQAFDGTNVDADGALTLPVPAGGRASLALALPGDIDVVVDGLAPGFSAAAGDAGVVVKAPYDLAGTVPARLVATCTDDGHDTATLPLLLKVRAPRVHEIGATSPAGPAPRSSAAVTLVGGRALFVAGGAAAGGAPVDDDVWLLDLETEQWRPLPVTSLPSALHAASLDDHSVLAVGAGDGAGFIVNIDVSSTSHLSAGGAPPSDTLGGAFAFLGGAFVSLCGVEVGGGPAGPACAVSSLVVGDDGAQWTRDTPTGFAPMGRRGAAYGVDADQGRVILFGGARDDGPGKDTWQLDVTDLQNGNVTFGHLAEHGEDPPARIDACGVVDPASRRFFVFGGIGEGGAVVDVPYVLDLDDADADHPAKWRPMAALRVPARAGCFAAWDATRRRILLGFGHDAEGEHANVYAVDL